MEIFHNTVVILIFKLFANLPNRIRTKFAFQDIILNYFMSFNVEFNAESEYMHIE
jgi:hypothetical protein